MLSKLKNRNIAAVLALTGTLIPLAGLHKFYLRQPGWGLVYLLLSWTPIPHVASAIEGVWYLAQNEDDFDRNFNFDTASQMQQSATATSRNGIPFSLGQKQPTTANQVSAIADALRQLDSLREDGLISEYEFEQKRRQLLDKIK